MTLGEALNKIVNKQSLQQEEMRDVMRLIMTGEATSAQIGAFLVGLRMKGETLDEITGAAEVMRELATPVDVPVSPLVDTCGTGGDGSNLFNVSTASAFVVAAAGAYVAKHGNRSVSSSTGSADVLEKAGVNLNVSPEVVARAIKSIGVGFMFAPAHHGAMKHAIGPRKELGMRTIFNILGPMTNPAGAKRQVLGVFDSKLCETMANVLKRLGSEHVLVVHAEDGLDEFSVSAASHVAELKDGEITTYKVNPQDFGINYKDLSGLRVSNSDESLKIIKDVFAREDTPNTDKATDIIKLNAGAAIYVSGISTSLKEGIAIAEDVIASGAAQLKLNELVEFTSLAEQ